jgi:gluconokinase
MTGMASTTDPVLVITMGVSGCGKSTVAARLASEFDFQLIEADDFHPPANKAHMASGRPLTDAMREPWIARLCAYLLEQRARGESCVLAWSGLRRAHRQRFRGLGYPTLFLHLDGSKEVIRQRMQDRDGHFMPAGLLDSQFEALEAARDEPDIIAVDIVQDLDQTCRQSIARVHDFLSGRTAARYPGMP